MIGMTLEEWISLQESRRRRRNVLLAWLLGLLLLAGLVAVPVVALVREQAHDDRMRQEMIQDMIGRG